METNIQDVMTDVEIEEMADEVLEEFDFAKIHRVMRFLDWTWSGIGVPSAKQLRQTAKCLLTELIAGYPKSDYRATGGLEATAQIVDDDGRQRLEINLSFAVEDMRIDSIDWDAISAKMEKLRAKELASPNKRRWYKFC